jgi:hypothetical protein
MDITPFTASSILNASKKRKAHPGYLRCAIMEIKFLQDSLIVPIINITNAIINTPGRDHFGIPGAPPELSRKCRGGGISIAGTPTRHIFR